jgi:PKD repeat protein
MGLIPIFLLALAGCGSCEGSRQETTAPALAEPTPVGPVAPPAGGEQASTEPDCFVIVDAEPDLGAPPLKVVFETEVECTAEPVTYKWDFGDGTTGGNEANPTHVYNKPGDYVATVTVTSSDGGAGSDEIDITVDELLGD